MSAPVGADPQDGAFGRSPRANRRSKQFTWLAKCELHKTN